MANDLITLNVVSVHNRNCTSFEQLFDPRRMSGVRANMNPINTVTITEAGDTQTVLSNWFVAHEPGCPIWDGRVLYWALVNDGNDRYIYIYENSARTNLVATGYATIANGAAGTVWMSGVRDKIFNGSVLVTIGGGGALDDTDSANTLTFTTVYTANDLQLDGETEFTYQENIEQITKYTVEETLAEVVELINEGEDSDCDRVFVTFVIDDCVDAPIEGVIASFGYPNGLSGVTDENGLVTFDACDGNNYTYFIVDPVGGEVATGNTGTLDGSLSIPITLCADGGMDI